MPPQNHPQMDPGVRLSPDVSERGRPAVADVFSLRRREGRRPQGPQILTDISRQPQCCSKCLSVCPSGTGIH